MLGPLRKTRIETERMTLRLPQHGDYRAWVALREGSMAFLQPWEPEWAADHLSRKSFTNRVYWAQRSHSQGTALALFLTRKPDGALLGAITLDNVRRGPAQSATMGYWIGQPHARQGYMAEAIEALSHHAFRRLDLSRLEAACLEENAASRGLLEKSGFKYEGVAQSYLQIAGRWRNHVLYAMLRMDRRGRV
ncbi:GNAT family N-acetyltransferase [Jannaschia seohaensis]|uniref:Ribosomal-protein-alanine N-acetyltransferase n=1 Tax=Jannaschia seohaensis TaxID=475081 RepID=A0A2Y9A295_9RHOB|nr:GNAT family protein [Jannaschia seohaensis]PWJ22302.1 ribosomal-protein-alanine N-acetyltransferase [Jannaschia seohaensis]SSA38580.1 ribosomal-protein-alanine N-acetyltransferase [Jannaschia seohaensis]